MIGDVVRTAIAASDICSRLLCPGVRKPGYHSSPCRKTKGRRGESCRGRLPANGEPAARHGSISGTFAGASLSPTFSAWLILIGSFAGMTVAGMLCGAMTYVYKFGDDIPTHFKSIIATFLGGTCLFWCFAMLARTIKHPGVWGLNLKFQDPIAIASLLFTIAAFIVAVLDANGANLLRKILGSKANKPNGESAPHSAIRL